MDSDTRSARAREPNPLALLRACTQTRRANNRCGREPVSLCWTEIGVCVVPSLSRSPDDGSVLYIFSKSCARRGGNLTTAYTHVKSRTAYRAPRVYISTGRKRDDGRTTPASSSFPLTGARARLRCEYVKRRLAYHLERRRGETDFSDARRSRPLLGERPTLARTPS